MLRVRVAAQLYTVSHGFSHGLRSTYQFDAVSVVYALKHIQLRNKSLNILPFQASGFLEYLSGVFAVTNDAHDLVDGAMCAAPEPPDDLERQRLMLGEQGMLTLGIFLKLESLGQNNPLNAYEAALDGRLKGRRERAVCEWEPDVGDAICYEVLHRVQLIDETQHRIQPRDATPC